MINFSLNRTILAAALFSGCFFMYACENDVNEVRALGAKKAGVDEGRNIDSYLSTDGKMRAHLTAPLLLRYQGDTISRTEFPNSLHVDFFSDSMKVESQLSARYGEYIESKNKVFLRDHVVAFNIKGDTLFCPELYWDQNTGNFYTDKRVVWSQNYRKNLFIGRKGMTCNQQMTVITLFEMEQGSYLNMPDSLASTSDSTKP